MRGRWLAGQPSGLPGLLLACLLAGLVAAPLAAKPMRTSPRPLPKPLLLAAPAPAEAGSTPATAPGVAAPEVVAPGAALVVPPPPFALPSAAPVFDAPASPAPQATAPLPSANPALAGLRPLPRPKGLAAPPPAPPTAPPAVPAAAPTASASLERLASLRPLPRPKNLRTSAERPRPRSEPEPTPAPAPETAAAPAPRKGGSMKGSVCGVAGIIGQEIAPIKGTSKGCGLEKGVKLTSVSGIRMSQPLTVDCPTAIALKRWIDKGIVPAVGRSGGGLAALEVGPGYVCRPRNNVKGGKISEHGRGKAIDLMALRLANGQRLDVLGGWKSHPKLFKAIHGAACGPFGTVLGPKSDRYHQNHIHVDTASYRSGPYCR